MHKNAKSKCKCAKFKIDLIVWKLLINVCIFVWFIPFKIDLIVWKSGKWIGIIFRQYLFKIDLIVWKYRLFRETNDKLGCLK